MSLIALVELSIASKALAKHRLISSILLFGLMKFPEISFNNGEKSLPVLPVAISPYSIST